MKNQTQGYASSNAPTNRARSSTAIWFLTVFSALVFVKSGTTERAGSAVLQTTVAAKADAAGHQLTAVFNSAPGVFYREGIRPRRTSTPDETRKTTSADRQAGSLPSDDRRRYTVQRYVPVSGIQVVTGQIESTLMIGEPIVRCGCR